MTFDGSAAMRGPLQDVGPDEESRAVLAVCAHSRDAEEAKVFLEMLDILPRIPAMVGD